MGGAKKKSLGLIKSWWVRGLCRAKKALRALQTNLTDEQRTKEIRRKERFGKHVKIEL